MEADASKLTTLSPTSGVVVAVNAAVTVPPTCTDALEVLRSPTLSVTVNVTLNVPANMKAWLVVLPDAVAPSQKTQAWDTSVPPGTVARAPLASKNTGAPTDGVLGENTKSAVGRLVATVTLWVDVPTAPRSSVAVKLTR